MNGLLKSDVACHTCSIAQLFVIKAVTEKGPYPSHERTGVKKPQFPNTAAHVYIRLNPEWKSGNNDHLPPWQFSIRRHHHDRLACNISHFWIQGTCTGGFEEIPGATPLIGILVQDVTLAYTDPLLAIVGMEIAGQKATRTQHAILVRLNTPWLRDRTLPPWRVLIQKSDNADGYEEHLVQNFILTGYAYGKRVDFPEPVGRKVHLACEGECHIDEKHIAHIVTAPMPSRI